MALKKEQILKRILEIVQDNYTHRDYDRVKAYAVLMKQLMTGEDLDSLMIQFNPGESPKMFEQRKRITNHIVKPLSARPMKPVQKISKVNPAVDDITYDGNKTDKRIQILRDAIKNFWGEKSLDDYLGEKFLNYQGLDPNAWMLQLFDNFDFRFDKAKPYIVEVSSTQAIDFQFANNDLQYLAIKTPIFYEMIKKTDDGKPIKKEGNEYQIYGAIDAIRLVQVDEEYYKLPEKVMTRLAVKDPKEGRPSVEDFYKFDGQRVFMVQYFTHKANRVPAWRIGALKDPGTDYRTCVSIFDNAIPYFKKAIKVVSEFDITMSLHTFPQKFIYVPECGGYEGNPCINGYNNTGVKCKACDGTGLTKTHTTGQDVVEIPMPDIKKQLVPFDLSKLVYYAVLPIEVARLQKEVVDEFEDKVWGSIYNTESVPLGTVQSKTATKDLIDLDSVYDTLQPIASHWALSRCTSVMITAAYMDLMDDKLKIVYRFPKDFKFKSVKMLMTDLSIQNDAQAPAFVKQDTYEDLASNLYADRPEMMMRYKGRQKFDPFEGKTPDEIQFLITSGKASKYSQTLYAESKRIYKELEDEAVKSGKFFWSLEDSEQQKALDAMVEKYMKEIEDENQVTAIPFDPSNPAPPGAAGNPAGSPGEPGTPKPGENPGKPAPAK